MKFENTTIFIQENRLAILYAEKVTIMFIFVYKLLLFALYYFIPHTLSQQHCYVRSNALTELFNMEHYE